MVCQTVPCSLFEEMTERVIDLHQLVDERPFEDEQPGGLVVTHGCYRVRPKPAPGVDRGEFTEEVARHREIRDASSSATTCTLPVMTT